jgi:membrane-associated phospholipid phosphatase
MKEALLLPKSRFLSVIVFFLLFFTGCPASPASAATDGDSFGTAWKFGQICLDDTKDILTSPREWGRAEWAKAALAAGVTLILYQSDREIRDSWQQNRSDFGDDFFRLIGKTGHVGYLAPALGLWYLYARRDGDSQAREAALAGLESVLIAGSLTTAVKLSFRRSRPYTEAGPDSFDGPGLAWDDDCLSFCSLHSAAAFAVATAAAEYYQDKPWTPIVAYSVASLAALSRINDDQHWSSDVFCGAVLGHYIAKLVVARRKGQDEAVSITPLVTGDGIALVWRYRF